MKKILVATVTGAVLTAGMSLPAEAASLPRLSNDYSSDTFVSGYSKSNCSGTRHTVYQGGTYAYAMSFKSPQSGYGRWANGNIIKFSANYCINIPTSIHTFN